MSDKKEKVMSNTKPQLSEAKRLQIETQWGDLDEFAYNYKNALPALRDLKSEMRGYSELDEVIKFHKIAVEEIKKIEQHLKNYRKILAKSLYVSLEKSARILRFSEMLGMEERAWTAFYATGAFEKCKEVGVITKHKKEMLFKARVNLKSVPECEFPTLALAKKYITDETKKWQHKVKASPRVFCD